MPVDIRFEPILLGTQDGCEEGQLGLADNRLVTVLVRLCDETIPEEQQSWYLETGFGRCEREGLIFSDLHEAEAWIREQSRACLQTPASPAEGIP